MWALVYTSAGQESVGLGMLWRLEILQFTMINVWCSSVLLEYEEYYLLAYNAIWFTENSTDILEEHVTSIFRIKE
jgi:hypothetical protein